MDYKTAFSSAVREMPRFMALAKAILDQVDDLIACVGHLNDVLSANTAVGEQLDWLGFSLGIVRPVGFNDDNYREYINLKLMQRTWDGTNENVPAVLQNVDPEGSQVDNCNLTVSVDPGQTLLVDASKVYPIPAGVGIA